MKVWSFEKTKRSYTLPLSIIIITISSLIASDNLQTIYADTVIATVPVGMQPAEIAFDSANGDLYVVNNAGDYTVSVIDGTTNTVVDTIPVGFGPFAIAFDSANGDLYVGNLFGNTVSVIDGSTNTVVKTITVGSGPRGIAYDSANGD